MTIPLTNVIDPQDYEFTSLKLMEEFLTEFFNTTGFDASLETIERTLATPLTKPILFFFISGGTSRQTGGVGQDAVNRNLWGEYKDLIWDFRLVTDDATGGALTLSKYAGHLDYIFRKYQFHLAKNGLRKSLVSPPIPLNTDEFYQKSFTVTNQALLCWETNSA